LRHVETSSGCQNPSGFGGGDEVADLTDSQSHKNIPISANDFSNFTIACCNARDQDQLFVRV
jgi:hypothetical protein